MKALFITTMIIAGSLVATTGYSQVYVGARFGVRIPAPRVYCAPAPAPVVYQDEYAPAPEYAPQPEYAPAPGVEDYPVETYVNYYPNYPAWGGHYRDHVYFDHYRPFFNRYRNDHYREFSRIHEEHRDFAGRGRDFRGENRSYDRHADHYRR